MEEQFILRVPEAIAERIHQCAIGAPGAEHVDLEPIDNENYYLHVGGSTYPVKLVTLPCVVESHRACDAGVLYKSGQVTRMLYAYEPKDVKPGVSHHHVHDPRQDKVDIVLPTAPDPTPESDETLAASGLTPPTANIVKRRFARALKYMTKYSREEIGEGERVVLDMISSGTYEHVIEELVDAEAFMAPWFAYGGDNVTIEYTDGVVTDMYQLRFPGGVHVRHVKTVRGLGGPDILEPNDDGTFGMSMIPIPQMPTRAAALAEGAPAGAPPGAAPAAAPAFEMRTFAEPAALPGLDGNESGDDDDPFGGLNMMGDDLDFAATGDGMGQALRNDMDLHGEDDLLPAASPAPAGSVTMADADMDDLMSDVGAGPPASGVHEAGVRSGSVDLLEPSPAPGAAEAVLSAEMLAMRDNVRALDAKIQEARDAQAAAQRQAEAAPIRAVRARHEETVKIKQRDIDAMEAERAGLVAQLEAAGVSL